MNHKGPKKYSNQMIQTAIAKFEGGAKLTAIAKELNVNKSTVKYWLDNATKFMTESSDKNPIISRAGQRLVRESWDIVFASLKELKSKLSEMSGKDLVLVVSELLDLQSRFGTISGKNTAPDKVLEKSEELKITVQKYLQKKISDNGSEFSLSNQYAKPIDVTDSVSSEKNDESGKNGKNNAI